jgi:hypothetical protein
LRFRGKVNALWTHHHSGYHGKYADNNSNEDGGCRARNAQNLPGAAGDVLLMQQLDHGLRMEMPCEVAGEE